jgi:UDP-N-acetylglucosamine 2-epimerase
MIHITTDCVFSGKKENINKHKKGCYNENDIHDAETVYGQSKSHGEPNDCTIIRTSIIGEENNNKLSLLEWIISQNNKTIDGFTNNLWNGVTCYQLAKIMYEIIDKELYWIGVRHIFSPNIVSKYDLCRDIIDIYGLQIKLTPKETDFCDRTLISNHESLFQIPTIHDQLLEQKGKIRKVVTITGIRPDFIRMSYIFKKLDENFDHILIHTGQHYDELLSGVFFDELAIRKPDYTLACGKEASNHYEQLSYLATEIPKLMKKINPSLTLFLGDSNTSAISMVLKKEGYKIGHIEAGMRSGDKRMLEEINRTVCDHCSDILFVYHDEYKKYLERENITKNVFTVGNTIVEPCGQYTKDIIKEDKKNNMILMDIHRPENFKFPDRMQKIIEFGNLCYHKYKLPVKILFFHGLNKCLIENNINLKNIEMIPLQSYKNYLNTVYNSLFIISDSGTGQEEPALLNTPVIVPRDYTERPQSYDGNCSIKLDLNNFENAFEYINNINNKKITMDTKWLGNGNTSELVINHVKNFIL